MCSGVSNCTAIFYGSKLKHAAEYAGLVYCAIIHIYIYQQRVNRIAILYGGKSKLAAEYVVTCQILLPHITAASHSK